MKTFSYCSGYKFIIPHIRVSYGAWQVHPDETRYCQPSFVPSEYWKDLPEEQIAVTNINSFKKSQVFMVFPLSEAIYNAFNEIRMSAKVNNNTYWDILQWRNTPHAKSAAGALHDLAKAFCFSSDAKIQSIGVNIYDRELPTITTDPGLNKRLGLHTDIFDTQQGIPSPTDYSRVLFNLGDHDHWFSYIDMSIREIEDWYKQQNTKINYPSSHDCAMHLLHTHTDIPIYAFRVRPGEAYIAPTENCIHDGVIMDDKGGWIVNLAIRGKFNINSILSALKNHEIIA